MTTPYPPPVDKLLTYGDCREMPQDTDYLVLGLGPEHIPDLIRMATDEELHSADSDTLDVWAPVHAWRALGQLRAEAAIEPLLSQLRRVDEENDDWTGEELPRVFAQIGPPAIPALAAYLADPTRGEFARAAAASSLEEIGKACPDSTPTCADILSRQLERFSANSPTINGLLVASLLHLGAIEAAPIMERAFVAQAVDLSVVGDWEDVQIRLGLGARRDTLHGNHGPAAPELPVGMAAPRRQKQSHVGDIRRTLDPWDAEKRKQGNKKKHKR